ncbi:MAG: DUF2723 domain-containing protein [Crocinitomicaceae bacterium]|nr:DUF2723 domain-containing protein [Crocinitomicaceae bacterium]
MNYKKINFYLGWFIFLIATIVYFITIEDTVSLWDCGEYITAAYKLEVGPPPGAPFFLVLGRLFSFFAEPENVAVWINRLSGLSSSLTILFMFWSITMLVKKMVLKVKTEISKGDKIAIFGSAAIGALAYTFTESFWFSAVEGEVYAMSSLFTAAIFWAILKWDEEMMSIQYGRLNASVSADRWLLLIMFLLGLAIGVHLLGILVVPAIAYVIYFRYSTIVKPLHIFLVGVLSIVVLGFIQEGVIPGSVSLASKFEVGFVNTLGLPFFSGTIFFFILLIAGCYFGLKFARKKGYRIFYSALMGLILLLIGYGSFAVIVIRSNANTPLDENDPENLVTLHAYLKREQYGSAPILFGQYWNSELNGQEEFKDLSPFYLRRFVVQKNGEDIKAFKEEAPAIEYAKNIKGGDVSEKYFESNARTRKKGVATYAQTTFFPRMYWSNPGQKISGYKKWSGYDPSEDVGTNIGNDKQRLPSFGENMRYFANYQVNWMYWRYFMWNFSGRQNDIQGHGDEMRGNWISGFSSIDSARLGDQGEHSPYFSKDNPSNNRFYLLPLILGFIGFVFHFYRAPKDAFVVFLAFFFTGFAILVYLNQKPFEPRERDYAYAGSFYFFALWIGVGVYALYEAFRSFKKKEFVGMGIIAGGFTLFMLIGNAGGGIELTSTLAWLYIAVISLIVIGVMVLLGKVLKKEEQGASVAILLSLVVPLILGVQGWDDHDRSLKTSARDLAMNYLNSCEDNGIIFTNGDNDTFPLWYMQEVEGHKTSVRVCNLSLMQTDWYTNQMKMKAYESEPLPIKFTEDQILMYAGNTDQVLFTDLIELFYISADQRIIKKVIDLRAKANPEQVVASLNGLSQQAMPMLLTMKAADGKIVQRLEKYKQVISRPVDNSKSLTDQLYVKFRVCMDILSNLEGRNITTDQQTAQAFQKMVFDLDKSWNYTNLAEAMEFVRNDDNLVNYEGRTLRIFPSSGFVLPVNVDNAVKSGQITKEQKETCHKELRFSFDKRGITREQVMMLDVLANNDWERGIYFSSPGGSDVSMALYRAEYVKQNGMAFELSPLKLGYSASIGGGRQRFVSDRFVVDRMYDNLMENYSFGNMSNPDVLTDYYTRRHTSQYRLHFLSLAEEFISRVIRAESEYENYERFANLEDVPAEFAPKKPEVTKKQIEEYKKKAANLIKRSLEVMPADIVLDWSEPSASRNPRDDYSLNGVKLSSYTDGVLHDYVGVLYMAGEIEEAEKLGAIVADQLESVIEYFDKSERGVSTSPSNTKDLYAALDGYFKISMAAIDENSGNPEGGLAKRTREKIQYIYSTMFPNMFDDLREMAEDNGESIRRGSNAGRYANQMFGIQDYSEAIAIKYGLIDEKAEVPTNNSPSINDVLQVPAN